MSDELFEIAFSGQIVEGADLDAVKQKIGAIFKADEARLEHMFSGRRVVIKRQVDEITAIKYRGAFLKAGAICEVVSSAAAVAQESSPPATVIPEKTPARTTPAVDAGSGYVSKYPESEAVPQALLTEPLGVRGEDIQDLAADVAPVGSPMQHRIQYAEMPDIDTSGIDVAPVGSDLSSSKGAEPPPPPDTSGLSMAD